ncbi:MAG: arginase family protein [Proteobacteria bacterium]|nr:arginase family protein [Pseudomonadota bacterium]
MQICLLHLDDALTHQKDFVASCETHKARQLNIMAEGQHIRLWGKNGRLTPISAAVHRAFFVGNDDGPRLCFMGSGDFHHVTALLLEATLEKQAGPVTVIHFDNHPDWVHFNGGMHCGSWVNRVAAHENIAKVITIGVCSNDLEKPNISLLSQGKLELFPYNYDSKHVEWPTIARMGEAAFIEKLLSRIPTKDVYITLDKDVLAREDCESNWDQGVMRLPYLVSLLRAISSQHKIIGADITGDYSRPVYAGNIWTRILKRGEVFLDQPFSSPAEEEAAHLNSRTNHILLDVFSEVMPS